NRPAKIEIDVGNYSPAPRQVQIELSLAGAQYKISGRCPAGVKTTLVGEVTLHDAGWHASRARWLAADDALAADDERPIAVEVRPPTVYALLTRQPSAPQPISSHFLERALVPAAAGAERVVRIVPEQATA